MYGGRRCVSQSRWLITRKSVGRYIEVHKGSLVRSVLVSSMFRCRTKCRLHSRLHAQTDRLLFYALRCRQERCSDARSVHLSGCVGPTFWIITRTSCCRWTVIWIRRRISRLDLRRRLYRSGQNCRSKCAKITNSDLSASTRTAACSELASSPHESRAR